MNDARTNRHGILGISKIHGHNRVLQRRSYRLENQKSQHVENFLPCRLQPSLALTITMNMMGLEMTNDRTSLLKESGGRDERWALPLKPPNVPNTFFKWRKTPSSQSFGVYLYGHALWKTNHSDDIAMISFIEIPSIARVQTTRIIIWETAVEPRLERRDFLNFVERQGWSRPAALSTVLNFLHYWQCPISSPVSEGSESFEQCYLWQVCLKRCLCPSPALTIHSLCTCRSDSTAEATITSPNVRQCVLVLCRAEIVTEIMYAALIDKQAVSVKPADMRIFNRHLGTSNPMPEQRISR